MNNFCNTNHEVEAWYAIMRSGELPRGGASGVSIGGHDLLVRRFLSGRLMASRRYCPHMGTDLAIAAELSEDRFRCAFHGLTFDHGGRCRSGKLSCDPRYSVPIFPITERYGLLWIFLGSEPTYKLPELDLEGGWTFHYRSKILRPHHHIVISNGLDTVHTSLVHSFTKDRHDTTREGHVVRSMLSGGYERPWMKFLSRTKIKIRPLTFTFTAFGPSISVVDADWHGTRVVTLFTAHQNSEKKCRMHTMLWVGSKNPLDWIRAFAVITGVLRQDMAVLNTIRVKENFTSSDIGMTLYRDMVDEFPVFVGDT